MYVFEAMSECACLSLKVQCKDHQVDSIHSYLEKHSEVLYRKATVPTFKPAEDSTTNITSSKGQFRFSYMNCCLLRCTGLSAKMV